MIRFFFLQFWPDTWASWQKWFQRILEHHNLQKSFQGGKEIARKEMRRVGKIFKADEMGWLALGKEEEEDKSLFDTTQESKSWHRVRRNEVKWIKMKIDFKHRFGSATSLLCVCALSGPGSSGCRENRKRVSCVCVLWRRGENDSFLILIRLIATWPRGPPSSQDRSARRAVGFGRRSSVLHPRLLLRSCSCFGRRCNWRKTSPLRRYPVFAEAGCGRARWWAALWLAILGWAPAIPVAAPGAVLVVVVIAAVDALAWWGGPGRREIRASGWWAAGAGWRRRAFRRTPGKSGSAPCLCRTGSCFAA